MSSNESSTPTHHAPRQRQQPAAPAASPSISGAAPSSATAAAAAADDASSSAVVCSVEVPQPPTLPAAATPSKDFDPKSSFYRSRTDSLVAYAKASAPEAPGASAYISKRGDIDLVVLLKVRENTLEKYPPIEKFLRPFLRAGCVRFPLPHSTWPCGCVRTRQSHHVPPPLLSAPSSPVLIFASPPLPTPPLRFDMHAPPLLLLLRLIVYAMRMGGGGTYALRIRKEEDSRDNIAAAPCAHAYIIPKKGPPYHT